MKSIFKFICCGNVDDGKSTLIGRLLLQTGSVKEDQITDALRASRKNGSDKLELAMLLDGLISEREQQITIDIAHRYFDYQDIRFHILDCPGHEQYTKNMAIAAAVSDTGIVVIDCTKGISAQTRRHIEICNLLGGGNTYLCLCLTKVDLIMGKDGVPDPFIISDLSRQLTDLMKQYHCKYDIIPVSAVTGYNIDVFINMLVCRAKTPTVQNNDSILHVQCVKSYNGRRYYYTRVIGNEPSAGKTYSVYTGTNTPSLQSVTISAVHGYGCFELCENVDIERGDCLSTRPLIDRGQLYHKTIWFDHPTPDMLLKHGTRVVKIISHTADLIELDRPVFINNIDEVKQNGLGIIIDNYTKRTIGCTVFINNHPAQPASIIQKAKNSIIFNDDIIHQVGKENILKIKTYLQKYGYDVILAD